VKLGESDSEVVYVFTREFANNVLPKFADFVADAIGTVKGGVGLKNPSRGEDFNLFEYEEVLAKEDVVLGQKIPD
jgi:hypothetical protein